MRVWLKRVALLALAAALAASIAYGLMPQPPRVEVAPVVRAPLSVTVREEGRTRVMDRYVLSAPVPAFAHRLELKVGDRVRARQTVLELEPLRSAGLDPRARATAQARVAAAESALLAAEQNAAAAEAESTLANSELERIERLHEAGAVSKDALDQAAARARRAAATLRSAQFAVDVARYELEAARAVLSYSAREEPGEGQEVVELRSPVAGEVLRVIHESEGVVAAGQPLIEVGDPSALEVEVEVLSADAVRIEAGMQVILERWGGDEPLEGRVRRVEPVGFTKVSALGVEEQRVLVIVDMVSPPEAWRRLGDGYRVEATFVLWRGDDVLQVPSSALYRGEEGWAVYRVAPEMQIEARPIQLGRRSGLAAEVTAGLTEEDLVVTHPDDRIRPGVTVRLRE